MYCKYLNLRNNEELAQITMRKRNSTLNQSTLNCPGLMSMVNLVVVRYIAFTMRIKLDRSQNLTVKQARLNKT